MRLVRSIVVPVALTAAVAAMLLASLWEVARRTAPGRVDAVQDLNRLANRLAAEKRYAQALALLQRVERWYPCSAPAHYNRGRILHLLGRTEEALAEYDRAVELRPDYVKALTNRAILHDRAGEESLALSQLSRVIELSPTSIPARFHRGRILMQRGDLDAACAEFERVLALDADDAEAARLRDRAREAIDRGGGPP